MWGLCAAHTFLTVDPSLSLVTIDSKDTLGGVWAKEQLYPLLRANNLQGYYEFSDFPILEAGVGVKPRGILTGEAILSYLEKYADYFDLTRRLCLGTKVLRAIENSDTNEWTLDLESNTTSRISCSKLVVATGQASTPIKPSFSGLESFEKPVIHTVDLGRRSPALLQDVNVRHITIVGGSKSAHDAVYMFASAGKQVTWIIHPSDNGRGAMPMAKPYTQMGPWSVWLEGLLMTRPLTWFGAAPWSDGGGFGWFRWSLHQTKIGGLIVKSYFANMSDQGVQESGVLEDEKTKILKPDQSLLWHGTQASSLNYDQDFYQLVRDSQVSIIRGNITRLDIDSIILEKRSGEADSVKLDHQSIKADAIVCAIGYDYSASVCLEPSFKRIFWGCPVDSSEDSIHPNLDTRAGQELLSRFPILHDAPSQLERLPRKTPWRLWRFIAPPSQVATGKRRNLAFLNAITSYQTTIKAELTSLWTYAYLFDRLQVKTPTEEEASYEAALWSRWGKLRAPYGMQGKLADFLYDAMPYYDLLLNDLGLNSWRKGWGWFGEVFGRCYEVKDYENVKAEWIEAERRRKSVDEKKTK